MAFHQLQTTQNICDGVDALERVASSFWGHLKKCFSLYKLPRGHSPRGKSLKPRWQACFHLYQQSNYLILPSHLQPTLPIWLWLQLWSLQHQPKAKPIPPPVCYTQSLCQGQPKLLWQHPSIPHTHQFSEKGFWGLLQFINWAQISVTLGQKQHVGSYHDAETKALYVNRGNNPPSSALLKILNRDLCPALGITLQDSCGLVGRNSGKK